MKKLLLTLAFIFTLAQVGLAAEGNLVIEGKAITGKLDVGSGTLEIPNSTNLPASCVVGEIYMDTDATSGQRCYLCESENVWVLQGGGAGDKITEGDTSVEVVDTGDGHIVFTEDGAEVGRFTGGDIGIGIGSPTGRLHIHDADGEIRFTTPATGSTGSDGLVLGYYDGTYNKAFIWNHENTDLDIATNGTVRMTIQAGGDIDMKGNKIINVADPTSPQDAATKVYGDANWSGGGGDVVGPATHSASYVPQWDATPNSKTLIEGFTITAAGKALIDDANVAAQRTTLGLGTAATRAAEDSMTDGSNLPDGHAIKTYGDANWSGGGATDKIIEGDTSVEVVDTGDGHIVFTEDGDEKARITGGKIGFGINNPGRKLHIHDADSVIQMTTSVTGSAAVDGLAIGYMDSYGKPFIWNYENTDLDIATNGIVRMTIQAGGDIDMKGNKIINVADPTSPQNAATKKYVDDNSGGWPSEITYVAPGNNALSTAVVAASTGDSLMLGSGTYSQSVPVSIDTKSLTIRGAGKGKTIIAFSGCNGILITTGDESTLENFTLQTDGTTYYGLTVTGNDVTDNKSQKHTFRALEFRGSVLYAKRWARSIDLNFCWDTTFDNITIRGGDFVGYGIYSDFSVNIKVTNCYMDGLKYGIFLSNVVANGGHRSEGWAINTNTMIDCEYMVKSEGCVHIDVSHNMLDFVHYAGVHLNDYTHFGSVSDNWIGIADKPNSQTGVYLGGAQKVSVSNNTITGQGAAALTNGIIVTGIRCSIMGNFIENQNVAVWLMDTSTDNVVVGNVRGNCTSGFVNQGASNDLGHNIDAP